MQVQSQDQPVRQEEASHILALEDVTKTFPGVTALSEVALKLYPGEVTALIGENGAGKSTLVKILTGIYQADAGKIVIDGQPVQFPTAQAAADAGITAIHQETVLFDELSVAENIFLGHAPRGRFGLIDWAEMERQSIRILNAIGADIDPNTRLRDLGIANKHLVAISRALSIDARIVIMDEPTAALSHKEIEELYELIGTLKSQGKAILFISHKFNEIFQIADRYTVYRDGHFIADGLIENVPAIINESDYFSLSLLGDKYSEETKWDLSLSTTDLDKILTTMILKDLSIGASDSSYLFLVDEEGDTILSAGLFSELIFTSEDSISVIGIPEKIILDADNFSGRLEYQIIKTSL